MTPSRESFMTSFKGFPFSFLGIFIPSVERYQNTTSALWDARAAERPPVSTLMRRMFFFRRRPISDRTAVL